MTRMDFERQIESARPALLRRARRALPDNEIDDAVQDTLMIALAKEGWEKIEKPASWVLGVMDNVVTATVRKRRHPISDFDVETAVDGANQSQYDDLVDEMAEDEEVAEQVNQIMAAAFRAGLTSREEWVFYARLRGVEDAKTARTLGIECNAVRSYFSLAAKKVRATIAEDMTKTAMDAIATAKNAAAWATAMEAIRLAREATEVAERTEQAERAIEP